MEIKKSEECDIQALALIFEEARKTIAVLGIDQWQNGYPGKDVLLSDIKRGESYAVFYESVPVASFVLLLNGEPTYDKIYDGEWISGNDNSLYVAIHRVAVSVSMRGKGVSTEIINYAEDFAKKNVRKSLRIDTHEGNVVMRKMLEKHGFIYCGIIYLESGERRVAYEKILN